MWFPKREYHVEKLKIECSHMLTERYYSGHSTVLCLRKRGTVCQQVGFKSLCLNRTSSTVKDGFSANFSHFFFYPRPHGLFILPSLGWAVKKAREKRRDYWTSSKIPFKNFFPPLLSLSPNSHHSPTGLFRLQCAGGEEERCVSCDPWSPQWDIWGILWHGVLWRWMDCGTATARWVCQL